MAVTCGDAGLSGYYCCHTHKVYGVNGKTYTPTGFECAGGKENNRKWRLSLRVLLPDGTRGRTLGQWLVARGLDHLVPQPGPRRNSTSPDKRMTPRKSEGDLNCVGSPSKQRRTESTTPVEVRKRMSAPSSPADVVGQFLQRRLAFSSPQTQCLSPMSSSFLNAGQDTPHCGSISGGYGNICHGSPQSHQILDYNSQMLSGSAASAPVFLQKLNAVASMNNELSSFMSDGIPILESRVIAMPCLSYPTGARGIQHSPQGHISSHIDTPISQITVSGKTKTEEKSPETKSKTEADQGNAPISIVADGRSQIQPLTSGHSTVSIPAPLPLATQHLGASNSERSCGSPDILARLLDHGGLCDRKLDDIQNDGIKEGKGDGEDSPFALASPGGSFPGLSNPGFSPNGIPSPFFTYHVDSPSFGDLGLCSEDFPKFADGLIDDLNSPIQGDMASRKNASRFDIKAKETCISGVRGKSSNLKDSKASPRSDEQPSSDCTLSEATSKHLQEQIANHEIDR